MNKLRLALAVAAALAGAPLAPGAFAQQASAPSADTSASALHWAAYHNDLGAVKRLLSEGADPNLANRFGVTPLHEAAVVRNAEMLQLMLDAGGDANAVFGEGETVLMTAARAGDAESVRVLLAAGGLPDATENWHGQTALMWAAIENHADVVQLLDRRRRRSRPRLDEARLGQDQLLRRQRAEDARLGRADGAAIRGAAGLGGRRLRAARCGRRRFAGRAHVPAHAAAARDRQRPLHAGETAHRARRRRRRRLAVHHRRHAQSRATTRSGRTRPRKTAT